MSPVAFLSSLVPGENGSSERVVVSHLGSIGWETDMLEATCYYKRDKKPKV